MKRKADGCDDEGRKKGAITIPSHKEIFQKGLFAEDRDKYTEEYTEPKPYKHGVINSLINHNLRAVREEVYENVHFTPKVTDIYKIRQSGDLANLDGLDDGALEKLPSLLELRDAMYSSSFRQYVSTITGSGELSGRKTDMAINIYTPGSHLLCHDDAIGSRRVGYILYLTDPDLPWKVEWGGSLKLFPTKTFEDEKGEKTVTPSPDVSKVIPPAWNQFSFFAVQPGESFYDVEEISHAETRGQLEKDVVRMMMVISGWYHIPQTGEDGYSEKQIWETNSSLKRLQGNPDRFDYPKPALITLEPPVKPNKEGLDRAEIEFLTTYMAGGYLIPEMLTQVSKEFINMSCVTLGGLLSDEFSARLRNYIEAQEANPESRQETEKESWKIAKPPHKHQFLYRHLSETPDDSNPLHELLDIFLPSAQFRKWLALVTRCTVQSYELLGRRFRRGQDYSLGTTHDGEPRLEIGLGLTPTTGWGADEADEDGDKEGDAEEKLCTPSPNKDPEISDGQGEESEEVPRTKEKTYGKVKTNGRQEKEELVEEDDVGGDEVYKACDDDDVLFTVPASWNRLSIVLRDRGVFKYVKYVSKNAKGDRWDVIGNFGVEEAEEEIVTLQESSDEGAFTGFQVSDDSDSD